MESLLQLMHLGEGKFYCKRMREFIKVAKDLEVKEISKGVEIPNVQDNITEETVILNDEEMETNENNKLKQIIIDQTTSEVS